MVSCYDANIDAVMPNPAKQVLIDFKRASPRKEMSQTGSGFHGIIDNVRVMEGKDAFSPFK